MTDRGSVRENYKIPNVDTISETDEWRGTVQILVHNVRWGLDEVEMGWVYLESAQALGFVSSDFTWKISLLNITFQPHL